MPIAGRQGSFWSSNSVHDDPWVLRNFSHKLCFLTMPRLWIQASRGPWDLLSAVAFPAWKEPPMQTWPACFPARHLSPAAWPMPDLKKRRCGMLSSHSEADTLGFPTGSGSYTKSSPKSVMIPDLAITQGVLHSS